MVHSKKYAAMSRKQCAFEVDIMWKWKKWIICTKIISIKNFCSCRWISHSQGSLLMKSVDYESHENVTQKKKPSGSISILKRTQKTTPSKWILTERKYALGFMISCAVKFNIVMIHLVLQWGQRARQPPCWQWWNLSLLHPPMLFCIFAQIKWSHVYHANIVWAHLI